MACHARTQCGCVGGVRRLHLAAPSSPRRVRDRVGDTWLFFGLYKCTCSEVTFNSLDERVLRRLPERVLERLPCLLTTKSGLSRRFVDDLVDGLLRNSGFEEAARLRRSEQERLHTDAESGVCVRVGHRGSSASAAASCAHGARRRA